MFNVVDIEMLPTGDLRPYSLFSSLKSQSSLRRKISAGQIGIVVDINDDLKVVVILDGTVGSVASFWLSKME